MWRWRAEHRKRERETWTRLVSPEPDPVALAPRVEIVDRRTLTEVVSLTPVEARLLAMRLVERAEATRPPPLPGSRHGL